MSDNAPSFPPYMNGIAARGFANGDIEILIIDKGQSVCGCLIPAAGAGGAVAMILGRLFNLQTRAGSRYLKEPLVVICQLPACPKFMLIAVPCQDT